MTERREGFRPEGTTSEEGKESRSTADRGNRGKGSLEELAARLEILRRRDAEEPDGRWFLPLARTLRDLGALEEAGQVLRRGLGSDPDCLGGWVLLAQCYVALGELEVAKGLFEWVAARDRENPHVLRGLAQLMALKGDRRGAADGYRALLRVMPRDLAAQEALASLLEPEFEPAHSLETPLRPALEGSLAMAEPPGSEQFDAHQQSSLAQAWALDDEESMEDSDSHRRGIIRAGSPTAVPASALQAKKIGKPPRVVPPRGGRPILHPEPDADQGIFEPAPADLDSKGPGTSHREGRSRPPAGEPSPEGQARPNGEPAPRRRSLEGYRRWLERMAGQSEDEGERTSGENRTERDSGHSSAGPFASPGE